MTATQYDPDAPRSAEELALEEVVKDLAYRLECAPEGSAEHKTIVRQMEGIRRGELGSMILEEYDYWG